MEKLNGIKMPARWSVILAWMVIVSVVVCVAVLVDIRYEQNALIASTQQADTLDKQKEMQLKVTAQMAVVLSGKSKNPSTSLKELDELAKGSGILQLRVAIIAGELIGKEAAIERLQKLTLKNDDEQHDQATLLKIYTDHQWRDNTALATLIDHHGWYAHLAESFDKPSTDRNRTLLVMQPARKLSYTLIGLGLGGILVLILSIILFVTAIVLLSTGHLKLRTNPPLAPAGYYAQSVAIYLGGFVVIPFLFGKLINHDSGILVQALPLMLSVLLAVAWPMLCGVPFVIWREDIGLTTGKNILLEPIWGVVGYIAGLPITIGGFVIASLLLKNSGLTPTHPIMKLLADPTQPVLGLFFLACVFAPITEEIMFRGTLFQSMRPKVQWFISALITSIIFAAIHPQGWRFVPVLGAIGLVLNLIRRWRGSLLASMTAHALNNLTMLIFALLLYR